jgi:autotransporter-associated beta strand protein
MNQWLNVNVDSGQPNRLNAIVKLFFSLETLRNFLMALAGTVILISNTHAQTSCLQYSPVGSITGPSSDPVVVSNPDVVTYGIRDSGCSSVIFNSFSIGTSLGSTVTVSGTNAGISLGISGTVAIGSFTNYGTITGGSFALLIGTGSHTTSITSFNNNGTITGSGSVSYVFYNGSRSTIASLVNGSSGIIRYTGTGTAFNNSGTITNLINSGTISTQGTEALYNPGTITTLTNSGSFTGRISNSGSITTINNLQGSTSSPLSITKLPTNYNVIINDTNSYGQLSVSAPGLIPTTFNIYGNTGTNLVPGVSASAVAAGTYRSVLIGLSASNIVTSTLNGTYIGGYTWQLVNSSGTIWDLIISGGSSGGGSSGDGVGPAFTNIIPNGFFNLASIGTTAYAVFDGGILNLVSGNNSNQAFAVNSSGGSIQSPSNGTATLSGTFSGSGGLTFLGSGTTIMTGANTYSGGTTVAGGTLEVAGPSPTGTGDVVILAPGTLMGTGTVTGNGIVSGVIKPGNSPGYLSFAQNLTLNAGSTYQQDIAGTVQASNASPAGASGYYSFVSVGNQLLINSGATLTPRLSNLFSASEAGYGSSIYVPVLGDRFRMITAAGGITGRFTALTQPAELSSGTQLIAFYNVNNSNSLDLVTVPTSYSTTLSSSTTNAKSVAGVFDQLLGVNKSGTSSSTQDSLLYVVAGQTAANLPTFAQALAGEIHAASIAALPQTTQRVQQSVLARLGDYPIAPSQINPALNNALLTGGISATNTLGLPTASMSSNPAVNPNTVNVISAAVADGRAWGEIAYQRAERSSNSAGNGFNSNLYQIVTGVDAYSDAELGLKLGGGIALSNTSVSANGGNSTIQQGSLFAYGKMSVLQDYVLDGMVSLGLSSTNLSRNDPTGYTGGFSSKAVLGNDALVSVGISRGFEYSDLRVTPYARLSYQYVGQNSYDEGSGVAALNIARFSGSAVQGVIGVAAGSLNKDPLKDEYTYRANIAVGADTSGLLNPTLNTTLGGYSSSVTTASAGSAFVQVGLYGTVKIAGNAYAYAGVSGEARSGQTLYGGSVGLRLAF